MDDSKLTSEELEKAAGRATFCLLTDTDEVFELPELLQAPFRRVLLQFWLAAFREVLGPEGS